MSKVLWYTIATDQKHMVEEVPKLMKSFKKFNPDVELKVLGLEDLRACYPYPYYNHDYRLTPLTVVPLLKDYDCVVRLDTDQIITGNLEHVIEGEFDVAVVNNSSPKDWKNHLKYTGQRLTLYDIDPLDYVNCGFVVVKSKRFADHWLNLCNAPYFINYQFREQDMLNMLVNYFPYKVRFLDDGDKWHGLKSKGYWNYIEKRGDKLILPKGKEWPMEDKEIRALHLAGGGNVKKFEQIRLRFSEDVADYLLELIE